MSDVEQSGRRGMANVMNDAAGREVGLEAGKDAKVWKKGVSRESVSRAETSQPRTVRLAFVSCRDADAAHPNEQCHTERVSLCSRKKTISPMRNGLQTAKLSSTTLATREGTKKGGKGEMKVLCNRLFVSTRPLRNCFCTAVLIA